MARCPGAAGPSSRQSPPIAVCVPIRIAISARIGKNRRRSRRFRSFKMKAIRHAQPYRRFRHSARYPANRRKSGSGTATRSGWERDTNPKPFGSSTSTPPRSRAAAPMKPTLPGKRRSGWQKSCTAGGSKSCAKAPTVMVGPWRRSASKVTTSAIFSSAKGWREPGPDGVNPGADLRGILAQAGTVLHCDGRVRVRAGGP